MLSCQKGAWFVDVGSASTFAFAFACVFASAFAFVGAFAVHFFSVGILIKNVIGFFD